MKPRPQRIPFILPGAKILSGGITLWFGGPPEPDDGPREGRRCTLKRVPSASRVKVSPGDYGS